MTNVVVFVEDIHSFEEYFHVWSNIAYEKIAIRTKCRVMFIQIANTAMNIAPAVA